MGKVGYGMVFLSSIFSGVARHSMAGRDWVWSAVVRRGEDYFENYFRHGRDWYGEFCCGKVIHGMVGRGFCSSED